MSDFVHGAPGDYPGISAPIQTALESANSDFILMNALGESVYSRDVFITATAAASQELVLAGFVAKKSQSITQLRVWTTGTAAAATPTICRLGVYQRAANGDISLLAATANDTTLFAATNTVYSKALTAPWNKVAGVEYMIGLLIVSGAAMPTFAAPSSGWPAGMLAATGSLMRPAVHAKVTGQADLGAINSTIANASIVAAAFTFHCFMLS